MTCIQLKMWLGAFTLAIFVYLMVARVFELYPSKSAEAPMLALVAATGVCICLIPVRHSDQKVFRRESGKTILNVPFAVEFATRILTALAGWTAAMTWLYLSEPVPVLYGALALVMGLIACAGFTASLFAESENRSH